MALIFLAGWVMDFSKTVVSSPAAQDKIVTTELDIYMAEPDQLDSYIEMYQEKGVRSGVFSTFWHFAAAKFHCALDSLFAFNLPGVAANIADYFRAVGWAIRYHVVYSVIFFVVTLAIISIAGGAICRNAALQFARGEKPGLTEALRFSMKKFSSFFGVPLVPLSIITFAGLSIFLLGLIGNIPFIGELLIGISMPFALIAGALISMVSIGVLAGFNLMFPAVAYENSDSFDAISRSFSYVYAKPWRMALYTTVAAAYGAICYTFVRFLAFLILRITYLFLQLGIWTETSKDVDKLAAIWPKPTFVNLIDFSGWVTTNWSQFFAALLIHLFLLLVVGLAASFVISFYFSANTIIYAVLRNRIDNTAIEEIND